MQFSRELRDKVGSGVITVSFRLWQRPQMRAGGTYAVGNVHVRVDSLDLLPF
jgi:hypothetical protein